MISQLMFCHELRRHGSGTYYGHFCWNTVCLSMYDRQAPPLVARVTEDPEGEYWGWFDARRDVISMMIYPHEGPLEMCFPYGSRPLEERGEGRKIRVRVDEVREAAPDEQNLWPKGKKR